MPSEGPLYRPPSEANSLLIQATTGCPHNKCTFCMVYKCGPRYRAKSFQEIKADMDHALQVYGPYVRTLFLPSGNTIAMPTEALARVCSYARAIFPRLNRITVYGSSPYIHEKGIEELRYLKESGLSRIHIGLESGDDQTLKEVKKGTSKKEQIEASKWVKEAGIEVSLYVVLGLAGVKRSTAHALETADALNQIAPDFIRLRTFVPKIKTPMLRDIERNRFQMLSPHGVLRETIMMIENLNVSSHLLSDHYTNYVNIEGYLPKDKNKLLRTLNIALKKPENAFRPYFVGTE
ncbi:B12-binding domain-containing radical SAM protein [Magnetococcales bacterium HHB-1]